MSRTGSLFEPVVAVWARVVLQRVLESTIRGFQVLLKTADCSFQPIDDLRRSHDLNSMQLAHESTVYQAELFHWWPTRRGITIASRCATPCRTPNEIVESAYSCLD